MGLNLESILDKILLSIIGLVVSAIFGFIIAFITKKCKKGKNKHDDEAEADCEQNVPPLEQELYKDLINKLDIENCPTRLSINWKGDEKLCRDPTGLSTTFRAINPVTKFNVNDKKPSIYCYFEVTILELSKGSDFCVGFCDDQLSMKVQIRKDNSFKPKDVIGVGIGKLANPLPLEFFVCQNGRSISSDNISESFANVQPLYPFVTLSGEEEPLICLNFNPGEWRHDPIEIINSLSEIIR